MLAHSTCPFCVFHATVLRYASIRKVVEHFDIIESGRLEELDNAQRYDAKASYVMICDRFSEKSHPLTFRVRRDLLRIDEAFSNLASGWRHGNVKEALKI